jgi:hypothetical protein
MGSSGPCPTLPSPVCSEQPAISVACPFQFLVYYSVFFVGCGSVFQGARLVYPGGVVGILCATYLLTCWPAAPKQVWSQCLVVWEPSYFLSVMWHEEALYRLGIQGFRVLLLLGGFFLPSVAPASQQDF